MKIEEMLARESIRQTLSNYTVAGDRLRTDDFVAVFTEDAVLESEGVPEQDLFRHQGRDEIYKWLNRWRQLPEEGGQSAHQASFVRHHLSTCKIELISEESARARTYWTAYTDIGPDHCGYYLDQFRRVGEQWLICHRKIRMDWRSPNSLMFTAIARTTS